MKQSNKVKENIAEEKGPEEGAENTPPVLTQSGEKIPTSAEEEHPKLQTCTIKNLTNQKQVIVSGGVNVTLLPYAAAEVLGGYNELYNIIKQYITKNIVKLNANE